MCRISPNYAKMVWFPTFDAAYHIQKFRIANKGLTLLQDGKLKPTVLEVLQVISEEGLVLATGHISPQEVEALIEKALQLGISRILITHPLGDTPDIDIPQMKNLAEMGAFLELTYLSYLTGPQSHLGFLQNGKHVSIETMARAIKEIGAEHFILSSDLGQTGNALPPDGLLNFIKLLLGAGISEAEITQMVKENPGKLLGI